MHLNEYQRAAMRTANTELTDDGRLMNACLGLSGEVGEFCDLVKKSMFQGKQRDYGMLEKELGDVLWYVALAAEALNTPLEAIGLLNITKLKARYPEGFSVERANNRAEGDV